MLPAGDRILSMLWPDLEGRRPFLMSSCRLISALDRGELNAGLLGPLRSPETSRYAGVEDAFADKHSAVFDRLRSIRGRSGRVFFLIPTSPVYRFLKPCYNCQAIPHTAR